MKKSTTRILCVLIIATILLGLAATAMIAITT